VCFIEYADAGAAERAVELMNDKPLDKTNTFRVCLFDKFNEMYQRVESVPETYQDTVEYRPRPNLTAWLADDQGRDQYAVRFFDGDRHETHIYWAEPTKAKNDFRQLVYGGEREKSQGKHWCELQIKWSPKGSYLATYHVPGIVLWGGETFEKLGRFPCPDVRNVIFSPCERYVLTITSDSDYGLQRQRDRFLVADAAKKPSAATSVIAQATLQADGKEEERRTWTLKCTLWNIALQKPIESFEEEIPEGGQTSFKWSHDGNYYTLVKPEGIKLANMQKQVAKILKGTAGAIEVDWCPTANVLSYVIRGTGERPDSIILYDVQKNVNVKTHHYFNLNSISLLWHPRGRFVMMQIVRHKTKKTYSYVLGFIRYSEPGLPVEEFNIENPVTRVAFDPVYDGFVTTSQVQNGSINVCQINSYRIGRTIEPYHTTTAPLPGHAQASVYTIHFSPAGRWYILAALNTSSSAPNLYFFDSHATTAAAASLAVEVQEHVSLITWEISGRYVITASCRAIQQVNVQASWRDKIKDVYNLWNFQGEQIASYSADRLFMVYWRPRPPTELTRKQLNEIQNNLKTKYWKKYEAYDNEERLSQTTEAQRRRMEIKAAWRKLKEDLKQTYADEAEERRNLRDGARSDDEDEDLVEYELQEGQEYWFSPPPHIFQK